MESFFMTTVEKPRDYLFDNYKALLIFLVVTGHFIGPGTPDNSFLLVLKWLIFSFHMPAFIFISGYFSKKTLSPLALIQKLAVPYLVYEIIYYLFYTYVMHKDTTLSLLKPKYTLWYLMVLFFWRFVTPRVKKIPHYMILAVAAGLLIGFSSIENNLLSIPRALVFYPYFLAGTQFERESLDKFRTPKGRTASAVCVLLIAVLLAALALQKIAPLQIFYGRYNYSSMKQGMAGGVLWRLVSYGIGFLLTYGVMILMTERKLFCSCLGTRTMAIYLFHGLTFTYLDYCTAILENVNTFPETVLLLAACAFVTAFFSLKPFSDFTGFVSNLPLSEIVHKITKKAH